MYEETESKSKPCPSCEKTVDVDSRFCKYCAFDLTKSGAEQTSGPEMRDQYRTCPACRAAVSETALSCGHCGNPLRGYQDAAGNGVWKQNQTVLVAASVLIGVVLVVALLLSVRGKPASRDRSSAAATSYRSTTSTTTSASSGTAPAADSAGLTNAKVESAVSRLTSNLRVGGSITVEGIQEQPQQNQATADLRFNGFQYKADMAGTPLKNDRQAPKRPDINSPNFYEEMYKYGTQQVRTSTYSGRGTAILKRYNDGRWVLKEVRWDFNGWGGTIDVQ